MGHGGEGGLLLRHSPRRRLPGLAWPGERINPAVRTGRSCAAPPLLWACGRKVRAGPSDRSHPCREGATLGAKGTPMSYSEFVRQHMFNRKVTVRVTPNGETPTLLTLPGYAVDGAAQAAQTAERERAVKVNQPIVAQSAQGTVAVRNSGEVSGIIAAALIRGVAFGAALPETATATEPAAPPTIPIPAPTATDKPKRSRSRKAAQTVSPEPSPANATDAAPSADSVQS